MPEIIRLAPGIGYSNGLPVKHLKRGGKVAGAIATESARLRRVEKAKKAVRTRESLRRTIG